MFFTLIMLSSRLKGVDTNTRCFMYLFEFSFQTINMYYHLKLCTRCDKNWDVMEEMLQQCWKCIHCIDVPETLNWAVGSVSCCVIKLQLRCAVNDIKVYLVWLKYVCECIDDVIYPSSSAMKMIRLSKTAAANTSSTCWSVRQSKSVAKLTCSSQESSGRVRLMIWWKVTTVTNMSTVVPACHHSTDRALLSNSFYITISLYLFFFHFENQHV